MLQQGGWHVKVLMVEAASFREGNRGQAETAQTPKVLIRRLPLASAKIFVLDAPTAIEY